MNDKQEFIDIVEVVYRGARKGRGLVVSPKGKSSQAQLWKRDIQDGLQARVFHPRLLQRQGNSAVV